MEPGRRGNIKEGRKEKCQIAVASSCVISCTGNLVTLRGYGYSSCKSNAYPFLPACAVFSCVQAAVWPPVFGIFDLHADVNARDCTVKAVQTPEESLH